MKLIAEMNQNTLHGKVSETLNYFLTSLRTSFWALTASEEIIDSSFKCALELEEFLSQKEKNQVMEEILRNYINLTFSKPVDMLMYNLLQNPHINEHLTLYAIEKYSLFFSKSDFTKLLNEILSEIDLRGQIFKLIEEFPDVDLDFYRFNNFLCDLLSSLDIKNQVLNFLKTQTLFFLKATKHSTALIQETLVNEMISCLKSQTDLKLWFKIMKEENVDIILNLCVQHKNFFSEVLEFFDKFADETESNFDEDLNVIYSHLNLDFEDFVKLLTLFLNKKGIDKTICDYLESKTLLDKNYTFWVDVKACL